MSTNLVSLGQTRVQSVSIIPSTRKRCNARCLPCIAKMTPGAMEEKPKFVPLPRVADILDYGARAGAVTAIITSKSEPTRDHEDNPDHFLELVRASRSKLPQVDMHTNGLLFLRHPEWLSRMVDVGLNMITFSIASFNSDVNHQFMGINQEPEQLIGMANSLGINVRCSMLLSKTTAYDAQTTIAYIKQAKEAGADMVVVRELWLPDYPIPGSEKIQQWVAENRVEIAPIEEAFYQASQDGKNGYELPIRLVRYLPWGARVYDVGGVNVTFAVCDQTCENGTYKSIQLVPREYPNGVIGWRIQGSWGSAGDVLG